MYSLEFALSLANYIYLSILLKASPGQRDAGLFLYLMKETHSKERSVKYQGSAVSDTLDSGRGLEGALPGGQQEQGQPQRRAAAGTRRGNRGTRSWQQFGLRL